MPPPAAGASSWDDAAFCVSSFVAARSPVGEIALLRRPEARGSNATVDSTCEIANGVCVKTISDARNVQPRQSVREIGIFGHFLALFFKTIGDGRFSNR
jgi:hypothetical protein